MSAVFSKPIKFSTLTSSVKKSYAAQLLDAGLYFLKVTFVYPVMDTYDMYKERISRSAAFAKLGWKNYDFDSGFLYEVMEFKLKRIRTCLKNGHAIHEKVHMKALDEAIKIVERIGRDDYDAKYRKELDKKYGKQKMITLPPEEGDRGSTLTIIRTKVKTSKQKRAERRDTNLMYEKAIADRHADIDRLAEILKNHEQTWWD